MTNRLILDTDGGIDDAQALLLLIANGRAPDAITTVFGNVNLETATENVRQLRHEADDSCPIGPDGKRRHTYDYREGGCRQVKDAELSANLGWANPGTGSAMVMRRG